MQKRDIAKHIHQQTGILEHRAAKLLNQILTLLKTALQAGESITIQGFGKFTVRQQDARNTAPFLAIYLAS
jgi:nucleoid DNA-binding protein